MLTIAAACPRCQEPRTILHVVYERPPTGSPLQSNRETVATCTHCGRFVLCVIQAPDDINLVGNLSLFGDIARHNLVRVVAVLPHMPAYEAPEYVPERVEAAFKEGMLILKSKMWTPAAGAFRTALDRATKILWQQSEKNDNWPKDLSPRIQQLKAKLDLPKAIADWAHQVRIVGNEMHDIDDVLEEDARDAGHFAELFLTYTFTLPKRLEEFRARREAT